MSYFEDVICDANVLYRAYKASIKGSKWKYTTQKFMLEYLPNIYSIRDDLKNRTLQNGPVIEFSQNERGRLRAITSIPIRDRIIRHVLCDEVFMPEVKKRVIYDNGASLKDRGISFQRKRFEIHLRRYYKEYGNDGYILFGDFSKFYDNIVHIIAKEQLLELCKDDEFISWLLDIIFDGFKIDVSFLSDEEYENCLSEVFNKNEYRKIPNSYLIGEKWMEKSVTIGDQISQIIGIYYAHEIDNYVKYVRAIKFYGRYMDDWYVMAQTKEELLEIYEQIRKIAKKYGIHINEHKTFIVKMSSQYRYLQVRYTLTKDGKVLKRINPKRVTTMRRKLKKLKNKLDNSEKDYESIENMFQSWICSFYKLMSRTQRENLIKLYEELYNVEISIENKKLVFMKRGK